MNIIIINNEYHHNLTMNIIMINNEYYDDDEFLHSLTPIFFLTIMLEFLLVRY